MGAPSDAAIAFVRLPSVDLRALAAVLGDPRIRWHLPLARDMSEAEVAEWAEAKDAQWAEHGYGPWGILLDGPLAGWGGFQREGDDADYALVLSPWAWGAGAAITREALRIGFAELGFSSVTVLLPLSRRTDAALARLGFSPDGHVDLDGHRFARFRLAQDRMPHTVWDPPPHPVP